MNINDLFPSRWLKADVDLAEDGDLRLTIKSVTMEEVGQGQDAEMKPVLFFEEMDKGLVLNKTNATTVSTLFGGETDAWVGKKISLFATEVMFQGKQSLGIRVRMRKPRETPAQAPRVPVAAGGGRAAGPDPKWGEDDEA